MPGADADESGLMLPVLPAGGIVLGDVVLGLVVLGVLCGIGGVAVLSRLSHADIKVAAANAAAITGMLMDFLFIAFSITVG